MVSKFSKRTNRRKTFGAVSAEFAATIALILPVVLLVLFACYEAVIACMIYNALNHSAHTAAMALARAYGSDVTCAKSLSKQQVVLDDIKFANMVVSPEQFSVKFPESPVTSKWTDNSGNLPTVSVTCRYAGGKYGLATFPNPDPLHLGRQFSLEATATAYLEGF